MKKRKVRKNQAVNEEDNKPHTQANDLSYDENQGFGNWLWSSEGVTCMRLFVITNSIVMFMTMTWPHVTDVMEIISSYFTEQQN
ncbi:hypothetical protein L798_06555 [Zootermopsis nevadensis]|uniref:Uncharacterized protein n=1 Tax=Zootermopsis nevadensis TaxID=136037 RepID=A0A067R5M7_ZOONE|nr:hypothetical protein L798_06555 [Zootermopsis nevadensis]